MASPFANFGTFFDVEYRVNGVWNELLHQAFAGKLGFNANQYVVCAETYPNPADTDGKRMDLSINKLLAPAGPGQPMRMDYAYLCFEGKGANGDTWTEVNRQVLKWYDDARVVNPAHAFSSWCIGARGQFVTFYKYIWTPANAANNTPANSQLEFWTLTTDSNRQRHWEKFCDYNPKGDIRGPTFDLTTAAGLADINTILTILANAA